jgi:hypothetical protein
MKPAQLQPEMQFEVSFLAARHSVAEGALRWLHILGDLIENLFRNGRITLRLPRYTKPIRVQLHYRLE